MAAANVLQRTHERLKEEMAYLQDQLQNGGTPLGSLAVPAPDTYPTLRLEVSVDPESVCSRGFGHCGRPGPVPPSALSLLPCLACPSSRLTELQSPFSFPLPFALAPPVFIPSLRCGAWSSDRPCGGFEHQDHPGLLNGDPPKLAHDTPSGDLPRCRERRDAASGPRRTENQRTCDELRHPPGGGRLEPYLHSGGGLLHPPKPLSRHACHALGRVGHALDSEAPEPSAFRTSLWHPTGAQCGPGTATTHGGRGVHPDTHQGAALAHGQCAHSWPLRRPRGRRLRSLCGGPASGMCCGPIEPALALASPWPWHWNPTHSPTVFLSRPLPLLLQPPLLPFFGLVPACRCTRAAAYTHLPSSLIPFLCSVPRCPHCGHTLCPPCAHRP